MHVYRLANSLYIDDLSGAGARLRGGRWNEVGTPVVYAACSVALAAWEVRVHLSNNILPRHDAFSLAVISIPDDSILSQVIIEGISSFRFDPRTFLSF